MGGGGHGAEPGETFRVALGSRNGLFKGFMMRAEEEEEDDRPRSSRGGREKRRAPRGENEIQLPSRTCLFTDCVCLLKFFGALSIEACLAYPFT